MFPKIMNDENFFKKAAAHGEEPPLTPQNEHQRSGLRFARRVRLPRAVGLAGMFLPIASTLVSHPPPGWWWLMFGGSTITPITPTHRPANTGSDDNLEIYRPIGSSALLAIRQAKCRQTHGQPTESDTNPTDGRRE